MNHTINFFNQENLLSCQRHNALVMLRNFLFFYLYPSNSFSYSLFSLPLLSPPLSHFSAMESKWGAAATSIIAANFDDFKWIASMFYPDVANDNVKPCKLDPFTDEAFQNLVSSARSLTLTHQHIQKLLFFFFFAHVVVVLSCNLCSSSNIAVYLVKHFALIAQLVHNASLNNKQKE